MARGDLRLDVKYGDLDGRLELAGGFIPVLLNGFVHRWIL